MMLQHHALVEKKFIRSERKTNGFNVTKYEKSSDMF